MFQSHGAEHAAVRSSRLGSPSWRRLDDISNSPSLSPFFLSGTSCYLCQSPCCSIPSRPSISSNPGQWRPSTSYTAIPSPSRGLPRPGKPQHTTHHPDPRQRPALPHPLPRPIPSVSSRESRARKCATGSSDPVPTSMAPPASTLLFTFTSDRPQGHPNSEG